MIETNRFRWIGHDNSRANPAPAGVRILPKFKANLVACANPDLSELLQESQRVSTFAKRSLRSRLRWTAFAGHSSRLAGPPAVASERSERFCEGGGVDGARTRDLRRDRRKS